MISGNTAATPDIYGKTDAAEANPTKQLTPGAGAQPSGFADRYATARPLDFSPNVEKLNHGVFRYPAKFHPPIARKLIELVSKEGDTVFDPFCGSGTLLVEASTLGRNSVGTDVDPLAVFVSRAKTGIVSELSIVDAAERCRDWLASARRQDENRWGSFFKDISIFEYQKGVRTLSSYIPDLPNLHHWFRSRAVLQLAAIRRHIDETYDGNAKQFLQLCFASIIRNSSNADPVPVSGLEVTSHMLRKEREGRLVDPWTLMTKAISKTLLATQAYISACDTRVSSRVVLADARKVAKSTIGVVHAVVTSPPYLTAVDYYRRHTLEMYWLGLTEQRSERLELMGQYIGRDRIGGGGFAAEGALATEVADRWMKRFSAIRPERERAFRHYCDGMARTLANMADIVVPGGPIVVVVGDVRFCGVQVSMLELMKDLAGARLEISDHLWYPILNRYMSYARRNEASIAADHVLVFR